MKLNLTSEVNGDTLSARELDHVVGGSIVYQFGWVSPMAIHGFNPQPDPPAILAHVLPGRPVTLDRIFEELRRRCT